MRRAAKVVTESIYDRGAHVRVGDVETYLVRAGPHGAPPVVFLHGIPTSAYLYRNVVRGMHEDHDCIAFDWPGYGLSEAATAGDYTHRARADHLATLLDLLELDRVTLVVHDMGGPAGLLFAVENPDRIERLVVLNTTVFKRDYRPPLPALTQFVPGLRELARPLFTRPAFDLFMRRAVARPGRLSKPVLDNHWALLQARAGPDGVFDSWAQLPDGADAIRIVREGMPRFEPPVLVAFGAEDPFLPPPNAERFAKAFPNARLELLPGAGHFLQEDAPEEVAQRIQAFLAE